MKTTNPNPLGLVSAIGEDAGVVGHHHGILPADPFIGFAFTSLRGLEVWSGPWAPKGPPLFMCLVGEVRKKHSSGGQLKNLCRSSVLSLSPSRAWGSVKTLELSLEPTRSLSLSLSPGTGAGQVPRTSKAHPSSSTVEGEGSSPPCTRARAVLL